VDLLLDTVSFVWGIEDSPRLSPRARELLRSRTNRLVFSAVSAWELAIKAQLGRFQLPEDLGAFLAEQVAAWGLEILAVEMRHAVGVRDLPLHHRDPFDRLLVAQAQAERLTLLSPDPAIARYDVAVVW
jgi:PIN domain nuclease of toxin-antitoxin system